MDLLKKISRFLFIGLFLLARFLSKAVFRAMDG